MKRRLIAGRGVGRRLTWSALLALGVLASFHLRCNTQYALLMTVTSTSLVETFDLRVKDLETGDVVLERIGEPIDPAAPNRDISKPGEQVKIVIEFAGSGNYLVHMLGRAGQGSANLQYALKDYQVDDVREVSVKLVPLSQDGDGDGFPACGSVEGCGQVGCAFLDCDDDDPLVHPFGTEVCGNGKDDDCSARCDAPAGEGDEACVDSDGDGVPTPQDCDDSDPCRAPGLQEAPNLCETGADAFKPLPEACLEKLKNEGKTAVAPFCGDGIDQDCNGQDVACRADEDCDTYSPPADCNDKDAAINPGVVEACDGVDNNCDGAIDEGCVPCDVDGDGHALPEVTAPDCTDDKGDPLPKDDTDDFDSGVFPRSTTNSEGKEGGTVELALRQYCSPTVLDKNGKLPQREIDHDGDGKAAKDDGCPDPTCDVDGDGFSGPQCSPPKSLEDCDDTNPQIFPGAPDLCGDGIKQNCADDVPCAQVNDRDGDGWGDDVDCVDDPSKKNAAKSHPWAKEICDGVDNDCDGLVDEGNPGPDGTPIPTDVDLCNDNNEGQCGGGGASSSQVCTPGAPGCSAAGRLLSGKCACSRTEPKTQRAEGNRVQCGGEDLAALASPRCFGATQPESFERCDDKDWDCNGAKDDPTGKSPMVDAGKSCGTDIGNCKAGVVVGCDLSQSLPEVDLIESVLKAEGKEFNRFWVCKLGDGGDVWFPTAERCNGKDDDCNGNLPTNEVDVDGDQYIPCSGCQAGAGRLDLITSLKGCGDCNNDAKPIYPGAPELCNDIDDNCKDGKTDDGDDECGGGDSCCSAQKACKNLQTDTFNCGGCGTVCPSGVSDSCVAGSCACGGATPCGPGLNCSGGSCQCIPNGRCAGCCDGNTCRTGNTVSACGTAGEACDSCSDGNECTSDVCSGGNCSNPDEPRTTDCQSGAGQCYEGSCCTGCVGGGQCRSGDTTTYCGQGGGDCSGCTAGECLAPTCSGTGTCGTTAANEGGSCSGGTCHGGSCCDGAQCWDVGPSQCVASNVSHCGVAGVNCVSPCPGGSECQTPACGGGSCSLNNVAPGTSCPVTPDGKCYGGACCSGSTSCWTGSSCTASSDTQCGQDGGGCSNCVVPDPGECLKGECQSGACVDVPDNVGNSCNGGAGNCAANGTCCTGCLDGSDTCRSGTSDSACGDNGEDCSDCTDTGQSCSGGSCGCGGCFDGGSCVSGTSNSACGTGGGTCTDCTTSGETCSGGGCVCAGCDDGGSCKPGSDDDACGSGGGSCIDCLATSETCSSGSCVCGGCYDIAGGGDCVGGTSDTACGSGGIACIDCDANGDTCNPGLRVCE